LRHQKMHGRRSGLSGEDLMTKWRGVAWLFLALAIVVAPALAQARAGGSYGLGGGGSFMSQGSRGTHSYDLDGGQPLQRSLTPQPGSGASPYGTQPGFGPGHPFITGLAGAFFGSWLGSLFFPHWGMGMGYGGVGGVMGSVLSWLVIMGLIWMAIRFFGRRFAPAVGPGMAPALYRGAAPLGLGYGGAAGIGVARGAPLGITQADYQEFEAVLTGVQSAWSQGDLAALRRLVTPEMLAYFAEELAANQSQGVANHVESVTLAKGDLREAWDEGHLHYATALLHWRAIDYTTRLERPDVIVDGDPQHPSEAAELWTFARSPGGHWLLSAIQQV
jgi:predicted lipid-binding transport protein (Tim44 family)